MLDLSDTISKFCTVTVFVTDDLTSNILCIMYRYAHDLYLPHSHFLMVTHFNMKTTTKFLGHNLVISPSTKVELKFTS
jgi:hypothetical protein